jgi:hypothetical protein
VTHYGVSPTYQLGGRVTGLWVDSLSSGSAHDGEGERRLEAVASECGENARLTH